MTSHEAVKLNIVYSLEQEIQRAQYTIGKFSWYLEQGYPAEIIKLPSGVTRDSSDAEIVRAMSSEYADTDYAECAKKLQEEWGGISEGFERMRDEPSFHLNDEYNVVLTKYGMGGSYNTKTNSVIVKLNTTAQGGVAGTIVHEIVHMTIQYLIDQYQVRHWYKERLVDLLLEHYFPRLKKMQNIKEDISVVDQAFEKFFPDMEAVARSIRG